MDALEERMISRTPPDRIQLRYGSWLLEAGTGEPAPNRTMWGGGKKTVAGRRGPARKAGSDQCDSLSSRRMWVLWSDVGSTHWSP